MILTSRTSKPGNALNSIANAPYSSLVTFCMVACLGAQGILAQQVTTQAGEKVSPKEFNGDVRNLPQTGPASAAPKAPGKAPAKVQELLPGQSASIANEPAIRLAPAPSPSVNVPGLSFNSVVTGGTAGSGYPPDTNGDVGRNHYIQAVNSAYGIYSKSGALLASFTENALFAGTGNICESDSFGDPVALYDTLRDRWILTHFAFRTDSGGNPIAPFFQCFAASKTNNPVTGGWWLYAVRMDSGVGGQPAPGNLNDYGKFGIWTDCLYMSANEFQFPGGTYSGTLFASFSKNDMYAGLALTAAYGTFGTALTDPFTMIPSHLSGNSATSIPPAGTPNYFVSESQSIFAYEVRKFTAGPNCGAGGTLSAPINVSQTPYTFASGAIVPQPGTAQRLDMIDDRLMQRVQYRKLGAAESLWVVHNVNRAPVASQWAQINVSGGTVATTPVQQQIYAPDATLHRFTGSIAADGQGNAALGYSTSGSTAPNFPSIAYSGRLVGDPLNQLPQSEVQLQAGTFSQTFIDRWGDYSAMVVDPTDDCTFWYTNQYYDTIAINFGANWKTRIGAFKFPTCVASTPTLAIAKTHAGNFTQGQVGATYTITVSNPGTAFIPGSFTVTDTLPAGLTATAISGTGWSCVLGTLTCTRPDLLLNGASFPAITLTVNVAANAPALVTNNVQVASSIGNATAADPTTIVPAGVLTPDLTISKSHTGNFVQGQVGATYTIVVTNSGTGPTTGAVVTVTDVLPAGLTATAMAGSGWTCNVGTVSCTSNAIVLAGNPFPSITLTVNVAVNAAANVINGVSVTGGGETNTTNNTANDTTVINPAPPVEADSFQVRYAANLTSGDSVINITNTGANGASLNGPGFGGAAGNICVNVYAFSPDEQLVSCCSCLLTPNGLVSLSVNNDLISNTLTGVRPNSVVVKLVNTAAGAGFTGTNCTNSAALAGGTSFPLAGGMLAYGTTIHGAPVAGTFGVAETPFLKATLSPAELASITNRCTNIVGNGSTFGICRSCRVGGLGSIQ